MAQGHKGAQWIANIAHTCQVCTQQHIFLNLNDLKFKPSIIKRSTSGQALYMMLEMKCEKGLTHAREF